jgi:thiol-disulfide isomerase/thioredoxin
MSREQVQMTTIAQKDRQTVRDVLARELMADVELLLFTRASGQITQGTGERPTGDETRELLDDLASLSERLRVTTHDVGDDPSRATEYNVRALPTVIVRRTSADDAGKQDGSSADRDTWLAADPRSALATLEGATTVRFLGQPGGYEFSTLVADIVDVSRGGTSLKQATRDAVRGIDVPVHVQVFVTPNCPYCPPAARVAHQFAMENPLILAEVIEANEFHDLSERYAVRTVPKTIINDRIEFVGSLSEAKMLEAVLEAVRRAG